MKPSPLTPAVSILTPTYNHASYLEPCLQSALRQTFPDWEQLILDDGSTDATPRIAATFQDPRIRYLRQEHRGVFRLAETYNVGLQQARAPLIAILEGDDLWHPDMLKTQMKRFQDPQVVLSFAQVAAVVGGEIRQIPQPMASWPAEAKANDPLGSALPPILCFEGMPQPMTWIIRRSALEAIGGFRQVPGIPTTDYPTLLALCLQGRFAYTPQVLAYWRQYAGQTSSRFSGAVFTGCADYALQFYEQEIAEKNRFAISLSPRRLRGKIHRQRVIGHLKQGRYELLARRGPEARDSFGKAWREGSPLMRIASGAGWCLSWLGQDLEWCARLIGKQWYRRPPEDLDA